MSATPPRSPTIAHFEWGRLCVALYGEFKDAKLWPDGRGADPLDLLTA